jgi:glycolate oxidase iron-sulfur subunit
MQTELHSDIAESADGQRALAILRACVHCGFCNATCPTYQVTGDELDGPRGRIYLIKEMLEEGTANRVAARHLDRCLTCRACETTCPSGVAYGELLEVGRELVERDRRRGPIAAFLRGWLLAVVPNPRRFRRWARLGGWFRWMLPPRLGAAVPKVGPEQPVSGKGESRTGESRRVLVLQGCVQRTATPGVNRALTELLNARDYDVVYAREEGCCGSLNLHLAEKERALADARRLLDAVEAHLDSVEAVISTASGCGVTLKDYPRLLEDDPAYADRARALAEKLVDAVEFVSSRDLQLERAFDGIRVAWQAPCTLQHGQRITGMVEKVLSSAGYQLVAVADPHLCCGSAGTYSILQPGLAGELRERKLATLCAQGPDVIATANVGCQTHLAAESGVPVRHWLELLR